jgi:hypothetical protein
MALDENGNVRPVGWGKGLAEAISAFAGNPKADAEAEAFRTTSAFNKLKLDEAARLAERDKALDPARKKWRSLWTEEEVDGPTEVLADGLGVNPTKIKKPAAMRFDGERGFVFDQGRIGDIISSGSELYGPDFITKWHGFLTKAGPEWAKLTPEERNRVTRDGPESITGGIPMSAASKENNAGTVMAVDTAKANAGAKVKEIETDTNAKLQLSHGLVQDPRTGEWRIGPKSPIGRLLSGFGLGESKPAVTQASGTTEDDMTSYGSSGMPEVTTESDDNSSETTSTPDEIPQLFSGGDLNPPATKQYSDDKKSASSGKIADSIAAGGSVTENKDGSFSFKPSAPSREMNPAEQARQAANDMGVRSLPSETEKLKKRELDDQWAGGLAQQVARLVADEDGDAPDLAFIEPVVRQINDLRIDLERRGYDSDEARSLAVRLAVDSYSKYFQTNYEWPGKNRIELKQDPTFGPKGETIFTAHTGKSNTWGRDVTPDEVQKTVADDVAGNATEHVPNMYIDKPTYVKKIPETLTALGVPPDKQSNPDIQALAVGLMWMKDVKEYAPQNGWRFSEPSGVGGGQHVIRTMKDPAAYMKLLDEKIKQYEEYIRNKSK